MTSPAPLSKYRKMRLVQESKQWDIDADLAWDGLDAAKPLLPDCRALAARLGLSAAEELAFGQLLGLMAAQSISEHEKILGTVKIDCWLQPLRRSHPPVDLLQLGNQFFTEEAKHSQAFARYVDAFAKSLQLDLHDLQSLLPAYRADSWTTRLFRLNSRLGGRAIWWLVMITEEESIALFRRMQTAQAAVEPLFFDLNRHHYEEEIRHISYAPLMLRTIGVHSRRPLWLRFDYLLAEVLHVFWVLQQMTRLRRLRRLAGRHPFFATLRGALNKFERLSLSERGDILLNHTPYASQLLNPQRHKTIRSELMRSGELAPTLVQRGLTWLRQKAGGA